MAAWSAPAPAHAQEQAVIENPAVDAPSCFGGQTIGQQITPPTEIDGRFLTEYGFTILTPTAVDAELTVRLWGDEGQNLVIHTETVEFPAAPQPALVTLPMSRAVEMTAGQVVSLEFTFDGECPVRFAPGGAYAGGSLLLDSGPIATASMAFRLVFSDDGGIDPVRYVPPSLTDDAPDSTVGAAYTHQFAVGGSQNPTVSVQIGRLPTGLTLTETGLLHGTPTEANTFTVILQARDGLHTALLQVTIVISPRISEPPPPGPPPGPAPGSQTPSAIIGNPSTQPGMVGCPYTYQFIVVGSPVISVQDFQVPGLQLDAHALISGTPTEAGTFSHTVRVFDGTHTDARVMTVVIAAPPPPPPAPPNSPPCPLQERTPPTPPITTPPTTTPPTTTPPVPPANAALRTSASARALPATGSDPAPALVLALALLGCGCLTGARTMARRARPARR